MVVDQMEQCTPRKWLMMVKVALWLPIGQWPHMTEDLIHMASLSKAGNVVKLIVLVAGRCLEHQMLPHANLRKAAVIIDTYVQHHRTSLPMHCHPACGGGLSVFLVCCFCAVSPKSFVAIFSVNDATSLAIIDTLQQVELVMRAFQAPIKPDCCTKRSVGVYFMRWTRMQHVRSWIQVQYS